VQDLSDANLRVFTSQSPTFRREASNPHQPFRLENFQDPAQIDFMRLLRIRQRIIDARDRRLKCQTTDLRRKPARGGNELFPRFGMVIEAGFPRGMNKLRWT
jgi:hypothetical protein